VSVASAPPAAPSGEACPLCSAPLDPEQEWCLHCGAAARTRLAASPRWTGLLITLAVVVALSLSVLAAALVKLAGGSSTARATTTTVTRPLAALATPKTTSTPGSSQPGTSTSATGPYRVSKSATTVPRAARSKANGPAILRSLEKRPHKHGLLNPPGTG
jgi:hypothetical protein